jgi:heme o synthase
MATTNRMAKSLAPQTIPSKLRDFYTLTKPEVNLLILMTTSAGYYLASRGPFRIAGLVNTLVGTLLVASGTATLNQWMERVFDGQMRRTSTRPLPSGRLSAREALLFGMLLSVAGGLYLAVTVNLLAAFLAVSTLLSYLLVYTPLKRKTPLCTLLGAFPGAMPTLIGWAGASNGIDRHAWYLFSILFLWQFPHFLAIAWIYREDYRRAGFRMLTGPDVRGRMTGAQAFSYALVLVPAGLLPGAIGLAGPVYSAGALLLGLYYLVDAARFWLDATDQRARRLLYSSFLYLPAILILLLLNSTPY